MISQNRISIIKHRKAGNQKPVTSNRLSEIWLFLSSAFCALSFRLPHRKPRHSSATSGTTPGHTSDFKCPMPCVSPLRLPHSHFRIQIREGFL